MYKNVTNKDQIPILLNPSLVAFPRIGLYDHLQQVTEVKALDFFFSVPLPSPLHSNSFLPMSQQPFKIALERGKEETISVC